VSAATALNSYPVAPIEADHICREVVQNGFADVERMYECYGSCNARLTWADATTVMENQNISTLFADYLRLRGTDSYVEWSAFQPVAHRDLLGDMHVLELDEISGQMRYRLFGTNVAHRYGKDLTGIHVADNVPSLAALYHGLFLASATAGQPIYSAHEPAKDSKVKDCQRLMLPFGDSAGRFHRLLVVHMPARTRVGVVGSTLSQPW
jgi:hypothetical protein